MKEKSLIIKIAERRVGEWRYREKRRRDVKYIHIDIERVEIWRKRRRDIVKS